MNRSELIKNSKKEEQSINLERLLQKDMRFLVQEDLRLKDELSTVEESIEDWLSKPTPINNQFLTLFQKQADIKAQIATLSEIEKYIK